MALTDPETVPSRGEAVDAEQAPRRRRRRTARRRRRRRTALIWVLIVVASLIAFASVLTTWVNRQVFDNESWKEASADLIEDQQVRDAVSVFLANQLYDNVDVAAELEARLPDNLDALAAPLAGALRDSAPTRIGRLLAEPRVQELWINANAAAQQKLVNVLENTTGDGISTGEGVVTLDLGALVTELGTELGLSESALAKIPPDAGVITVMRSDQLAAAQAGVQAVRILSAALLVLVLALYALAIYLARGARRQTIRNIGFALVLVGLAVLVVRRVAGNVAIEALTAPPGEDAGKQAWLLGSEILAQIGWAAVLYGVIAVTGAVLAGPTKAAVAVRRWIAPVLNERPGIAWASVGAAFVLLVLWGGTHALRTWWGILLLGALIAVGVLALRRQTLREFPAGSRRAGAPPSPTPAPLVTTH